MIKPLAAPLTPLDWMQLAARLLLWAIFLLAGATKLVDPRGSLKSLREFGLPGALARRFALVLPLVEIATACALLPASLAWFGASAACGLLLLFSIAAAVAMARGRRPDCHCFGQLHSAPVSWTLLLRNAVLAACAGWLASRGQFQTGPDAWAPIAMLSDEGRKVALAIGFLLALVFVALVNQARPKPAPVTELALPDEDAAEARTPVATASSSTPAPVSTAYTGPSGPVPMGIGHPVGTPAPEFELPALAGGKRTLASLRAEYGEVILVFTSPYCETCHATMKNLVRWMEEMPGIPTIVLVTLGKFPENAAKLSAFDAARILIQHDFEVAASYDCDSTPTGVHVGADGMLRSELAVSGAAIKKLLAAISTPPPSGPAPL